MSTRGVNRAFAQFDFAAGDAPKLGPFVRANHEHVAVGIEDQCSDCHDWMGIPSRIAKAELWIDFERIALEDLLQFAQMLDD